MKNTATISHIRCPRDGAKDLIKGDMIFRAIIYLRLKKTLRKDTEDYSAYLDVKNKKVIVNKFYGVPVWEEFDIHLIMQEILKEVMLSLTPNYKVFSSGKSTF